MVNGRGDGSVDTIDVTVVSGGNKGIGLEICKQLAAKGVTVVLTTRDEKRGLQALEKLKESGISRNLVFHQLDLTDPLHVASLAAFINTQVNNAAIVGACENYEVLTTAVEKSGDWPRGEEVWSEIITSESYDMVQDCLKTNSYGMEAMVEALLHLLNLSDSARIVNVSSSLGLLQPRGEEVWSEIITSETYDMVQDCLKTNYYGMEAMVEALLHLLNLSDSARIVNVSSSLGLLQAKRVLSNVEKLSEERVELVLNKYLEDFRDGALKTNGWPTYIGPSVYIVSKATINAYTRIVGEFKNSGEDG